MDFQAVVLAGGKGSRMTDITSKCPKALLPVGQRPMVWYALNLLQNNGFKDAIIVLPSAHKTEIMTQIQSHRDIKLELSEEVIQSNSDEEIGTADALRSIIRARDIKKDLLVVSSDIITDASLDPLLALHYVQNSALTVLLTPISEGFLASPAPGPKTKRKVEKDLVSVECKTKRLMFMASEADFEDEVVIKRRVMKCSPRFQVFSNLQDAHVYIISSTVFDVWINDKEINSIKGDLIPHLCRKQFALPNVDSTSAVNDININEMSSCRNEMSPYKTAYSCYSYIDRDSFCIRANNLGAYMYANRQISRLWSKMTSDPPATPSIHPTIQTTEKSTVGNDCFIWKNVTVGGQSAIRGCVVGSDCRIGSNVKLTNCIVMDKANIADRCVLQGTIVCREAVLQEGCQLNNCVVAVDQVAAETKSANEIITNADRFMEI